MNKLNTFIHIFKLSISNPNYYIEASKAKFMFLFKYILVFSLIFGIIYNLYFIYLYQTVSNKWPSFYSQFKQTTFNIYPTDLIITLKKGELTTNKQNPIYIKIPEETKQLIAKIDPAISNDKEISNFITDYNIAIIDTDAKVEDIKNYKTLVFFTKNAYATLSRSSNENNYRYEFSSYSLNENLTINKKEVDKILTEFYTTLDTNVIPLFINIANVLLFSLWFFMLFGILSTMLITHLLTSFLGLIISKITKTNMDYSGIYKMGLLLFPFFMATDFFSMILKTPNSGLLNLILYICIITIVLKKSNNNTHIEQIPKQQA